MSYPVDLDEYSVGALVAELRRRDARRRRGVCDYCARDRSFRSCRFRERHAGEGAPPFDLETWFARHKEWSEETFGPREARGPAGPIDHLRKEIEELAAAPEDLEEVVDIIHLAIDVAWRAGHSFEDLARVLDEKQATNHARSWPDWRTAEPGKAIEHIRDDSATKEDS